jgi:hypothetical protein
VRGPGTGTSDEINARLSNGEYVIRASKVAQYGVKTFDAYNNGYAVPSKSLAGGYGQAQSFSGYDGSQNVAAGAGTPAPDVRVYIGNEQIDARIELVSAGVTTRALNNVATTAGGRAR